MKFENTSVFNFEGALRGMRNPKDSWDKSDSKYCEQKKCDLCRFSEMDCSGVEYIIGSNDMKLAQTLIKAGKEHRKFLRQIIVSVDITAPRYWWSEFDTYKIGTTANSCSTMHKLNAYPITIDMFEIDEDFPNDCINKTIEVLENLRISFNETKNIRWLRAMKQRLPESFLQKRTVTINYENVLEIIRQRGTHRLTEWNTDTMDWIKSLPYANEFLFVDLRKDKNE